MTTAKIRNPGAKICALLLPTTDASSNEIATMETIGNAVAVLSANDLNSFCSTNPMISGIKITCTTDQNILINETLNHLCANKYIKAGVKNSASNVETLVIATYNATIAFAK